VNNIGFSGGRGGGANGMNFLPGMPPPSSPPQKLVAGEITCIGNHRFMVHQPLGEGAYARVYEARAVNERGEEEGEGVAIKEMCCGKGPGILPDASLQRAMFEVEVMLKLQGTHAPDGSLQERAAAPRVLAHQFWPLGPHVPEGHLCRVAMERRPGLPLVNWLQMRAERWAASAATQAESDEVPLYAQSFLAAVEAAREMLRQLAPSLERLNRDIAIHRDVNARNLLVHADSDAVPLSAGSTMPAAPKVSELLFSLLDFGSSICCKGWLGGAVGSWQQENPTGDARYWSPACWVRFLGGVQALSQDPQWTQMYSGRLDCFAFGVCVLELFAKLHCQPAPSEAAVQAASQAQNGEAELVGELQNLRGSWGTYWSFAIASFERLGEYSRMVCCGDSGGAARQWQELSVGNIPGSLASMLADLCGSLIKVSEVCRSFEGERYEKAAETLQLLEGLISKESQASWPDVVDKLAPASPLFAPRGRFGSARVPPQALRSMSPISPQATGASVGAPPGAAAGNSLSPNRRISAASMQLAAGGLPTRALMPEALPSPVGSLPKGLLNMELVQRQVSAPRAAGSVEMIAFPASPTGNPPTWFRSAANGGAASAILPKPTRISSREERAATPREQPVQQQQHHQQQQQQEPGSPPPLLSWQPPADGASSSSDAGIDPNTNSTGFNSESNGNNNNNNHGNAQAANSNNSGGLMSPSSSVGGLVLPLKARRDTDPTSGVVTLDSPVRGSRTASESMSPTKRLERAPAVSTGLARGVMVRTTGGAAASSSAASSSAPAQKSPTGCQSPPRLLSSQMEPDKDTHIDDEEQPRTPTMTRQPWLPAGSGASARGTPTSTSSQPSYQYQQQQQQQQQSHLPQSQQFQFQQPQQQQQQQQQQQGQRVATRVVQVPSSMVASMAAGSNGLRGQQVAPGGAVPGGKVVTVADTTNNKGSAEVEAIRILKQVESEVRVLKRWYTEAIEALNASKGEGDDASA